MARDPVDELYEAPPREFVVTRNRIARPKATVWAINRIARTSPKAVREVVDAFDRMKTAQLRQPAKLAAESDALKQAVEKVAHAAFEALREAEMTATLDTHRRIATTLRGATASARGALLRGALTEEVAPGGFELFEGATPRGRLRVVRAS